MFQLAAVAAVGIALTASAAARAQSRDSEPQGKVYGYVDLVTGLFHANPQVAPAPETTGTLVTHTGTVEVTIKTTIDTTLPKGAAILCDVTLDANVGGFLPTQVAASAATISGTTATCTVNVPYAFTGPSGASAVYGGTYKVTASYVASSTQPLTDFNVIQQVTAPISAGTQTVIVLPADGTVTKYSFAATI
jgi:hypothetical protein